MNRFYMVLGICVLVAVFAGFYKLRLDSTIRAITPPEEPETWAEPQNELSRDFHDKDVSASDYAAQVNAREMTDAPSSHEQTLELLRLRAAAEKGDGEAQGRLGEMYHHGQGVERNLRHAFFWFRLGAVADDRKSLNYLGRYYKGDFPELGLATDPDKAERLLRRAADAGDTQAMVLLAMVLQEKVRTGEKDREEEAAWWYNRGTGGEWDASYTPPAMAPAEAPTPAMDGAETTEGGTDGRPYP